MKLGVPEDPETLFLRRPKGPQQPIELRIYDVTGAFYTAHKPKIICKIRRSVDLLHWLGGWPKTPKEGLEVPRFRLVPNPSSTLSHQPRPQGLLLIQNGDRRNPSVRVLGLWIIRGF